MTAIELLERALADAIACNAVAVHIQVVAADGSTWVYVSSGDSEPQLDGAREVAS